jgi:hypothetical protein
MSVNVPGKGFGAMLAAWAMIPGVHSLVWFQFVSVIIHNIIYCFVPFVLCPFCPFCPFVVMKRTQGTIKTKDIQDIFNFYDFLE